MTEEKREDRFYWAVMKVLRDNGHSRDRARVIYLELHGAIRDLLINNGELHIQGLLTVLCRFSLERTTDGFTRKKSQEPKWVVRATVKVRRGLRALLTAR